jgi:prepilin signal peptidase PulO-like enzyme (type II secretory pathway)
MELGLWVTATIVLTSIDTRIRVVPNELVAALLAMAAAFAILEKGFAVLPGRLLGLAVSLVLFVAVALVGGQGKIGGGDVKLAMAIGFAAGFPNILAAIVAMGIAAIAPRLIMAGPWSVKLRTPMPFAGYMLIGLIAALVLDKAQLLALLGS